MHVELDQKRVDLVITILDVGMTYANLSDTSRFEETVRRNDANARRAYATAVRLSRKLPSNTEDWQLIRAKLALLNKRLQAPGAGGAAQGAFSTHYQQASRHRQHNRGPHREKYARSFKKQCLTKHTLRTAESNGSILGGRAEQLPAKIISLGFRPPWALASSSPEQLRAAFVLPFLTPLASSNWPSSYVVPPPGLQHARCL